MEFLVTTNLAWNEQDPERRTELLGMERARVAELTEAGHVRRLWRIPGATTVVGVWHADSATELHAILMSLPLWEHLTISVETLAEHPVDPGLGKR